MMGEFSQILRTHVCVYVAAAPIYASAEPSAYLCVYIWVKHFAFQRIADIGGPVYAFSLGVRSFMRCSHLPPSSFGSVHLAVIAISNWTHEPFPAFQDHCRNRFYNYRLPSQQAEGGYYGDCDQ